MNIESMNEKSKIIAINTELNKQEKKLDGQIKLDSYSQAKAILDHIYTLGKQIEKLGYHVIDADINAWIDFGSFFIDK